MSKESILNFFNFVMKEVKRMWFFITFAFALLFFDGTYIVVFNSIAVVSLILVFMHITRKLIFPYIDMEVLVKQSTIHSSIIFASMIILLVSVIWAVVTLMT